jgi:hypothetical protein
VHPISVQVVQSAAPELPFRSSLLSYESPETKNVILMAVDRPITADSCFEVTMSTDVFELATTTATA